MSKHTPGPWTVGMSTGHNACNVYADGDNRTVAQVFNIPLNIRVDDDFFNLPKATLAREGMANARLIAAAPELLAALKDAKAWVQHWQRDFEANLKPTETSLANALSFISAAIAKAEE